MGDWTYYLGSISFENASSILKFAHEVNSKTDIDHLIQRELTSRSKDIVDYLNTQEQRLFGSLICASFGQPLSFKAKDGNYGFLDLSNNSKIYVLDGQHRLAAIQTAVAQDPNKFANDDIAILLVEHTANDEGYKRARRLFTTVNRYAKQTSKSTNRVMDEDDGVSHILLRLIREFRFFSQHIKCTTIKRVKQRDVVVLAQSEAMGKGDRKYIMSISSLYEVIGHLIPQQHKALFASSRNKARILPPVDVLDDVFCEVEEKLSEMIETIEPWRLLEQTAISDIEQFRNPNSPHCLVRPVAIIPFSASYAKARSNGMTKDQVKKAIEPYLDLRSNTWSGLLWNPTRSRMHGGQEVKRLTGKIWDLILGQCSKNEALEITAEWKEKVDPAKSDKKRTDPLHM